MELYYAPGACSLAAHIVARESGIPVELLRVDLATHKVQDGRDYFAVNRRGYVPALRLENGYVLTEVQVIVQYLADQAPAKSLMPPSGTFERLQVQQWLAFISTELHKGFGPLWHKDSPQATKDSAKERLAMRFVELNELLAAQQYLLGHQYTVADAYAYTILNWTNYLGVSLTAYPALQAYMARVGARAAVKEAMRFEGLKAAA